MCMNKDDKTHYYREDVFTFHIILFFDTKNLQALSELFAEFNCNNTKLC
jgi:hypothetical protein